MIDTFNNMPWHDAELKEILICRTRNDNIRIFESWPEGYLTQTSIIEFYDCYAFESKMNFGVVPPDYIFSAECISESKELDDLRDLWIKLGVDLSKLYCFKIYTNSTNSSIGIYSLGFRLINEDF